MMGLRQPEREGRIVCVTPRGGRIDDDDPKAPVLIYAASWVKMIFTGTSVAVTLANHHAYWTNEMGYLLDGVQGRIRLLNDGKKKTYEIAGQLPDARHICRC